MIPLLFVLTLTTAFHFELSRITPITSNGFVSFTYLFGSIFFLFWSEPYIMPNGFYILAWIQGISFLMNWLLTPSLGRIWNHGECVITLGVLSLMTFHAIKYFIK